MADPFGVFGPVPEVSDPGAAALLARAVAEPVGAGRLALLVRVDGALLGPADRVDHMVAWQECVSWATAEGELSVALVAGPSPDQAGKREPASKPTGLVAEDERCARVGAALRMTPYSAKNRIEDARSAADQYAEVTARVLAGTWTRLHLWHTGSACTGHAYHFVRLAIRNVCAMPGSELWTPTQWGRRLRAELVRLDSVKITDRIRARQHQRSARLDPADDFHGTITVDAAWPTVVWAFGIFRRWAKHERARLRKIRKQDPTARFCCPQAIARLLTHTRETTSDSGPDGIDEDVPVICADDPCPFCGQPDTGIPDLSALTADAVIAAATLLAAQLGDTGAEVRPTRAKTTTMAIVVIDLPTAFHLADTPGFVPGYGHVPAPIAREMLADADVWRRFLLDESGALVDTGASTYRPSDKLREHVQARDWTCTFPGCNQPAAEADLDHIDNFNGENTKAENLHPLCRRHHRVKTHTGWRPVREPDGSTTWISPHGHVYTNTVDTPWAHYTRTRSDAGGRRADAADGHETPAGAGSGAGTAGCPRPWIDLQTLHTGQIIITYPDEPGGPTVTTGPAGNSPSGFTGPAGSGDSPHSATGPTGAGTRPHRATGPTGAGNRPHRGDVPSDAGQGRHGGDGPTGVGKQATEEPGSAGPTGARNRSADNDGGAEPTCSPAVKGYLDGPEPMPPPPDRDTSQRTATHWPAAPYSPAEAALTHLITDHHTPPGRAP